MKKIPTLFKRDFPDNPGLVTREVNPECQWVIDRLGIPTLKLDGTAVMIEYKTLYQRFTVRKNKPDPDGFILEDFDKITGKRFGWVKADLTDPANKYLQEAWYRFIEEQPDLRSGTYELVGPKIQGGAEREMFPEHRLSMHGTYPLNLELEEITFDGIKSYLAKHAIEGIVWWHRKENLKAKIKKSDFGMKREDIIE